MIIIDGKAIAKEIIKNLKKKIAQFKKPISLALISVGNNPASISFIKIKKMIAEEVGVNFKIYEIEKSISHEDLSKKVLAICSNNEHQGVVVQLPLPKYLKTQKILDILPKEKDPDLLSSLAFGNFTFSDSPDVLPPVLAAIKHILNKHHIRIKGKTVVIIGQGKLVGLPSIIWFIKQGATTFSLNKSSKDIKKITRQADILITGAGSAHLINSNSYIKKGAVIIDAGASELNGKVVGDVDFKKIENKAYLIAPVPGGVGPIAVAMLFKNLIELNSEFNTK